MPVSEKLSDCCLHIDTDSGAHMPPCATFANTAHEGCDIDCIGISGLHCAKDMQTNRHTKCSPQIGTSEMVEVSLTFYIFMF